MKRIKNYCNKCSKAIAIKDLNALEKEELKKERSFVCSDCINAEMEGTEGQDRESYSVQSKLKPKYTSKDLAKIHRYYLSLLHEAETRI